MKTKQSRKKATWRVVKIDNTAALHRLVGPLAKQKGRQRVMCVAIGGGKRLKKIAAALNALDLEI